MIDLTALYTNIIPGRPMDTAYLFFILSCFLSSFFLPFLSPSPLPEEYYKRLKPGRQIPFGNNNNCCQYL